MAASKTIADAKGAGDAFLGFEVSWCFGAGEATDVQIPREAAEAAFASNGYPSSVQAAVPADELRRAAIIGWQRKAKASERLVVKELARPNKDTPVCMGVYYRARVGGEAGDDLEMGARVRVQAGTSRVVCLPPEGSQEFPSEECERWGKCIAEHANNRIAFAYNEDLSRALLAVGGSLGWVSRRQKGGVYFLPGDSGDPLVAILDALETLTIEREGAHQFHGDCTPQFADPRTLKTWARRTAETFEDELAKLTGALEDMTGRDNVRPSTWERRQAEIAELMARAERFAALLGDRLSTVKGALDKLKGEFGSAQEAAEKAKAKGTAAFERAAKAVAPAPEPEAPPKPEPAPKPRGRVRKTKEELDRLFGVGG